MPSYRRFLTDLIKYKGPIIAAEIGVFEGDLTEHLLTTCENINMIYCVDTWVNYPDFRASTPNRTGLVATANWPEVYANFVKRASRFKDRVVIIRKDSLEASECFEDDYFDFVFIDANHGYEYIAGDIFGWTRKVKVGGIVAGHDYVDKPGYGVIEAVKQFFIDDFEVFKRGKVWYHKKRANDNYEMYKNWKPPPRDLGADWYKMEESECDGSIMEN